MGAMIRARRLELGLTLAQAAKRIGTSQRALEDWESAIHPPRVDRMPGVIAFLGQDPLVKAESLAQELYAARLRLGLTREALGERLGLDGRTIARWETGQLKCIQSDKLRTVRAFLKEVGQENEKATTES